MTKDGFFLKDSDDELDEGQVKKSRKERKTELWIKRIVKTAAKNDSESETDSDSSTEETLNMATANSNYGKQKLKAQIKETSQTGIQIKDTKKHSLVKESKEAMGLTNTVGTSLEKTQSKLDDERIRNKDKADRATIENCLDPRTMI